MTVNILTAVELTADADHFWTPVLKFLAMTLIQNEHVPAVSPVTTLKSRSGFRANIGGAAVVISVEC